MRYTFTGETRVVNGVTLRRICAAEDFCVALCNRFAFEYFDCRFDDAIFVIKKGTLGGWLEKSSNLEQNSLAWVMNNACVYGNARVTDGAIVCDFAKVYGDALVKGFSLICNNAEVNGALVGDHARVSDNAKVRCFNQPFDGEPNLQIKDYAVVRDNAVVELAVDGGLFYIENDACIRDDSFINASAISVRGNAVVKGRSCLSGYFDITGNAIINIDSSDHYECCLSVDHPNDAWISDDAYIASQFDLLTSSFPDPDVYDHKITFFPDREGNIIGQILDYGCGYTIYFKDGDVDGQILSWAEEYNLDRNCGKEYSKYVIEFLKGAARLAELHFDCKKNNSQQSE